MVEVVPVVALVPVPPLPDAFPVDDVSVGIAGFAVDVVVIGCPPPVSVDVVPVVDGCSVSVDPAVLSADGRLQATQVASRAMTASFFIPSEHSKCEAAGPTPERFCK